MLSKFLAPRKHVPGDLSSQPSLITSHIGVWSIIQETQPRLSISGKRIYRTLDDLKSVLPYLFRFVKTIYNLGPDLVLFYLFNSVWSSFESTIALYYSGQLLNVIQARLQGHDVNGAALLRSVTTQVLLTVVSVFISNTAEKKEAVLRNRIKFHFMESNIESLWNNPVHLGNEVICAPTDTVKLDLPTLEDPGVKAKLPSSNPRAFDNPGDAWFVLESLRTKASGALDLVAQICFLVVTVRRQTLGPFFVAACVAQPVMMYLTDNDLWRTNYVQFSENPYFLRMKALFEFANNPRFKKDILSDDLGTYIQKEFKEARKQLGDTSADHLGQQWRSQRPLSWRISSTVLFDFPIFWFGLQSFLAPSSLSAGSMAIMQQTAMSIQWSIRSVLQNSSSLEELAASLSDLYALSEIKTKMKDGSLPYLPKDRPRDKFGMEIDFRNVSFSYPGTSTRALKNVSFTVKSGQLVVIVGTNGSGKSSIIKLLNRLFDPTEGEIFVDGHSLTSYKISDVRRSTAVLCQDHSSYPFNLRENITLGRPERTASESEVIDSARQGGALGFIQKLPKGFDTTLDPIHALSSHCSIKMPESLKDILDKKDKAISISGGESQRLAASRVFMKLKSDAIHLLAVDEPSSALDPEAECELHDRLRQNDDGKTVVFITHRFGNITKYADAILCMKDGELVEQGTHNELMAKHGEYSRMYQVQAQAFALDSKENEQGELTRGLSDLLPEVKDPQQMFKFQVFVSQIADKK